MKRILPLLAFLAFAVAVAVAFAQGPPPTQPGGRGPGPGMNPNFAPPPFPGDTMATQRDSLMNVVLKKIAGKEQVAAESVFKDIQLFKGRPAGQLPRIMNYGYGRAIGASCFHCHSKDGWDKDQDKKTIARAMAKMVTAINTDYISKIDGLGGGRTGPDGQPMRPTVNCSTCHRGSIHAGGGPPGGGPGGQRPGGPGR
jgi:hypothetical protein